MQVPTNQGHVSSETITLPEPFDWPWLLGFFAGHAVPGVEVVDDDSYARTLSLDHGPGALHLRQTGRTLVCTARTVDARDVPRAHERARRLLDLGSDPAVVDARLAADSVLAPLVARRPGLRVPGYVDRFEVVVRTVIGQQISVAGACAIGGRVTAEHGARYPHDGALTSVFPTPEALAAADAETLPMPRARGRALVRLARAVADGEVDLEAPVDEVRHNLVRLPGIGPWTADYVAIRAFGARDVFLPTDLGVRRSLARLGVEDEPTLVAHAWRPYRTYGLMHVWAALADPPTHRSEPR